MGASRNARISAAFEDKVRKKIRTNFKKSIINVNIKGLAGNHTERMHGDILLASIERPMAMESHRRGSKED